MRSIATFAVHTTALASALLLLSACGDDDEPAPQPGVVTQVQVKGGDGQSVAQHAQLPTPLSAQLVDGLGSPVAGVAVTFEAGAGSGAISGTTSSTGADGVATWRGYLHAAGAQKIVAKATGVPSANFTVNVTAAATGHDFDGVYNVVYSSVPPATQMKFTFTIDGTTVTAGPQLTPPQPDAFTPATGTIAWVNRTGIDWRYPATGTLTFGTDQVSVTGSGTSHELWMGNDLGEVWGWTAERL